MIAEMCISNYKKVEKEINKTIANSENKLITVVSDKTESIASKIETHYILDDNSISVDFYYNDIKVSEVFSTADNLLCIEGSDNIVYLSHKPVITDVVNTIESYSNEEKQIVDMTPYLNRARTSREAESGIETIE